MTKSAAEHAEDGFKYLRTAQYLHQSDDGAGGNWPLESGLMLAQASFLAALVQSQLDNANGAPVATPLAADTPLLQTPLTAAGLRQFDHMPVAQALATAWVHSGGNQAWHQQMRQHVRSAMPVLARALDRLARLTPAQISEMGDPR